jgi:hypothetical protein
MKAQELKKAFLKADKKVSEIEANGGVSLIGYGGVETSNEYDEALKISQDLYNQLIELGIDPFN